MRSRRNPDPFAALGEPEIARCREAARSDFGAAVRDLSYAADGARRAQSPPERLDAAYGVLRCAGAAAAVAVRYLRLGAHRPGSDGGVSSARDVRRAVREADRAARSVG
jgi:hypothetical protein